MGIFLKGRFIKEMWLVVAVTPGKSAPHPRSLQKVQSPLIIKGTCCFYIP